MSKIFGQMEKYIRSHPWGNSLELDSVNKTQTKQNRKIGCGQIGRCFVHCRVLSDLEGHEIHRSVHISRGSSCKSDIGPILIKKEHQQICLSMNIRFVEFC